MIPQDFIDQLLTRVDLVDVIERYVPLKKAGQNYMACCPFHKEKSPSFSVSPTKQFFHCFGCGKHGNAIGFVMEHTGQGFVDAIEELASNVGMTVPRDNPHAPAALRARPGLVERMEAAMQFYKQQLKRSPTAIDYLKGRGVTGEIAARFGLGFAPEGWTPLSEAFDDYLDEDLVECGLVIRKDDGRRHDRFRERIMFPIRNPRGQVIGFGGRVLATGEPKYLNSPETPLFQKGRELYGLFEARESIRETGRALVVEGYMDVVALAQYGIDYAVAALGTATTPVHVQKLLRQTDHVFYCFDGDAAGQRAAWRALENSLEALVDGKYLHFMFLPTTHDPDSYVRAEGREAFEQTLTAESLSLSAYFVHELSSTLNLNNAEDRTELVTRAMPYLAKINAPTLGLMLRRRVAELGRIEVQELDRLMGRAPNRPSRYPTNSPRSRKPTLSLPRRLLRWVSLNPALAARVQLPVEVADSGKEVHLLLELCALITAAAQPLTAAQLEERLRETELAHRLSPVLAESFSDGVFDDPDEQEFEDAVSRLATNIRMAWLERLKEKDRHQGLTPEEKQQLLHLLLVPSAVSRT